jgi:hypothetical protein
MVNTMMVNTMVNTMVYHTKYSLNKHDEHKYLKTAERGRNKLSFQDELISEEST